MGRGAGVTHGAHGGGQVFPAQLEDGQRAVAGHVLDVAVEALGSCGQNKNSFTTTGLVGDGFVDLLTWKWEKM